MLARAVITSTLDQAMQAHGIPCTTRKVQTELFCGAMGREFSGQNTHPASSGKFAMGDMNAAGHVQVAQEPPRDVNKIGAGAGW